MPKKTDLPTVSYSVRLTPSDKAWLDDTSKRLGVPMPTLLTWAIEALRQYANAHGGKLIAPIDIHELWQLASKEHPELALVSEGPKQTTRKPTSYREGTTGRTAG